RARWGTDYAIAVSDHIRRLLDHSPYVNKPIATIQHGIDIQRFCPAQADEKARQRQMLFGSDHQDLVVLGSSGGTDTAKGWLDLMAALSLLPAALRERFRVVVAGSQPNNDKLARVRE